MRALRVEALSDDRSGVALRDVPPPPRLPGQLLVRVHAAALNHPDLLMTRGAYQLKPALPFTPGMEMAGTVVEADADAPFRPGDRVVASTRLGALADLVAVDADAARHVPAGMDDAVAAAIGVAYLTAWVGLVRIGRMQAGDRVLVHGASGGVGLAAVDLALALGARVIATSRSPAKLAAIRADHALEAALVAPGFREGVLERFDGGANLVLDPVGGDVFDESCRCVAFGGTILVAGFTSGRIATLPTNIALIKGFAVAGVRAGDRGRRFPEEARADADSVWALAAAGRIRSRIHARYPAKDWGRAFDAMAGGDMVGKLVIDWREGQDG